MPRRRSRSETLSRRAFCASLAAGALGIGPAQVIPDKDRPGMPSGIASGDVTSDAAIIWSRTDRPARMIVEVATSDSFRNARRVEGPVALDTTDFTARLELRDLPPGERIFYRVSFESTANPRARSEPLVGQLRTAPVAKQDVLFAWSGDMVGQGWGINPAWGGLRIYETMRRLQPHFFVHSGDTIYADNPLVEEPRDSDGRPILLPDGKTPWRNLVTPAKSKVAETLEEFRGNHAYNLLDANARAFNAEVPLLVQWDDHEVVNNWFPGRILDDDPRYRVKDCSVLAARARRAFLEYMPIRPPRQDAERIYRSYAHGPLLELFVLDQRTYRGPNTANRQPTPSTETAFMGTEQLRWLKQGLLASKATWKVLCSDMPIGLIVTDRYRGKPVFENMANGDGPPLGRELEMADLLRFIKQNRIQNLVWLTADVHYAAAHHYHPDRAQFKDFLPFWEFVAGPMNAGTFGPGTLDNTFGPEVKFHSVPPGMQPNRPPSAGLQFFGTVRIDGANSVLSVTLHNLEGRALYRVELEPQRT